MTKTEKTLPDAPHGVSIDIEGGVFPVQIEGRVDGARFYFKARGKFWTVSIGNSPQGQPDWFWGQRYSDEKFEAGCMDLNEARTFLFEAIKRYRSGAPGNLEEHSAERELETALRLESAFDELEEQGKFKGLIARYREILSNARTQGAI